MKLSRHFPQRDAQDAGDIPLSVCRTVEVGYAGSDVAEGSAVSTALQEG